MIVETELPERAHPGIIRQIAQTLEKRVVALFCVMRVPARDEPYVRNGQPLGIEVSLRIAHPSVESVQGGLWLLGEIHDRCHQRDACVSGTHERRDRIVEHRQVRMRVHRRCAEAG